jgi:predicted Rdx family selenoprotein
MSVASARGLDGSGTVVNLWGRPREVALVPGTGGVFQIAYEGDLLWDRKRNGGFPDAKTLKQLVRDRIDPGRDLGHVDRSGRDT